MPCCFAHSWDIQGPKVRGNARRLFLALWGVRRRRYVPSGEVRYVPWVGLTNPAILVVCGSADVTATWAAATHACIESGRLARALR